MWNSIHYIQFPLGSMSQQLQELLLFQKSCSFSLKLTDRWLLQCNDTRIEVVFWLLAVTGFLSVHFTLLPLQLSIDTGCAGPRFLMRWQDLGLMYIYMYS